MQKKNSDTEPQSFIAYRIASSSIFSYCDLTGTFNVLTYTAATSYVADIFSTTSKSTIQGYGLHSTCRWCLMGLHSRWLFPLRFEVYISFTLFTCDCTLIYTLMYCVCQHTDPGMAQNTQRLDRLRSGRYTKRGGMPNVASPSIDAWDFL